MSLKYISKPTTMVGKNNQLKEEKGHDEKRRIGKKNTKKIVLQVKNAISRLVNWATLFSQLKKLCKSLSSYSLLMHSFY